MNFTEEEISRYARHILLPQVGAVGQERLKHTRVLVVGAGGLGTPLLLYLAAAGIGTIGVVDDHTVSLSNLQRQVIHDTKSLGRRKIDSVLKRLQALNPLIRIEQHFLRLQPENAPTLLSHYDLIADGSDNSETRYLLNDVCFLVHKPLVSAALFRFEGYVTVFKSYLGKPHPCYRCLFETIPEKGLIPSCAEAGVLGALAGVIGSLQAVEVLKESLGIGESLSGFLLLYDSLATRFHKIKIHKSLTCKTCHPS